MNIDVKIEELNRKYYEPECHPVMWRCVVTGRESCAVLVRVRGRGGHWAEETRTKNHAHVTHLTQKTLNITTFISLFNGVAKPLMAAVCWLLSLVCVFA